MLTTTNKGDGWTLLAMPKDTAGLEQIDCVTATQCFAAGSATSSSTAGLLVESTDAGMTWKTVSPPQGLTAISNLSCATANECVVIGQAGNQPVSASSNVTTSTSGWSITPVPAS
jgi:photosystem II stability/assembly factor-like uncharacterized protein